MIFAWVWGDVTRKYMNGIWKKTLKKFVHNIKRFAKDEEVEKKSTRLWLRQ